MKKPETVFIDFETQSNNDIRLGVNNYMSCPDFRAYLLSYSIDGNKVITLENPTQEKILSQGSLPKILKSGNYLVVSHNTNFDISVWNKIFPSLQIDWKKTLDTSWLCRVLNIPASLDKASKFFGQEETKDETGKKVLPKYYTVKEIPEEDLEILIKYNRQDVKALIELYYTLTNDDYPGEGNRIIYDLVQAQNEIKIDLEKFKELKNLKDTILEKTLAQAKKEFPLYKKSGEKEPVSIAFSANEIKKFLHNPESYRKLRGMVGFERLTCISLVKQRTLVDLLKTFASKKDFGSLYSLKEEIEYLTYSIKDSVRIHPDTPKKVVAYVENLLEFLETPFDKSFEFEFAFDWFEWVECTGVKLSTISKNKIEEELSLEGVELDKESQTLISLYRVLQSKGLSKYDTFGEYLTHSQNNIKDFQVSHGTHTGRPAGRGLQLHNVSRPSKKIENLTNEKVIEEIKKDIRKGEYENAMKSLSALLWASLIPDHKKHVIARYDLSSIEPRVGAFLRQDKKVLDIFKLSDLGKGKDLYTQFGEAMNFPEEISRQLSKICVLGFDYGQGGKAVQAICINAGLPDMGLHYYNAAHMKYHNLNPSVKRAWYELEKKFKLAIMSGYSEYNALSFKRVLLKDKKFIAVSLPSGRLKYYADCSISSNGKILYNDIRFGRIELRPYLLYENLVQASATDVLFLKAMRVNEIPDAKIKLTIYDEIIVSTLPKNIKQIIEIMREEETAFEGMPISFKGVESKTFWKGDVL